MNVYFDMVCVCSMRWLWLRNLWNKLQSQKFRFPTEIIAVMDNCCGQNKSQELARFDMMVEIILDVQLTNLYLKPGHSHMRADHAVANSRKKLRHANFYDAAAINAAMDSVEGVQSILVKDEFKDWCRTVPH